MKLTYEQLIKMGACEDMLEKFKQVFGEEVEVTMENADKAMAAEFGEVARWLVVQLLDGAELDRWNEAREKYPQTHTTVIRGCPACSGQLRAFVEIYTQREVKK